MVPVSDCPLSREKMAAAAAIDIEGRSSRATLLGGEGRERERERAECAETGQLPRRRREERSSNERNAAWLLDERERKRIAKGGGGGGGGGVA